MSRDSYRDQRALAQRIHPVLVPQQSQQLVIQRRLEYFHVYLVVLICMYAEIFNLAEGNRLVFRRASAWGFVVFRICAECTDIHFAGRYCSVRVDLP